MSRTRLALIAAAAALLQVTATGAPAVEPLQTAALPNIVLIFPDNLGWGEVGAFGSVRGDITPRLDRMAAEGLKLTNFNVEYSCTVSRAALMTGRYAIRSGATQGGGITLWEVTIAEMLKGIGYATGLFGKWHLGGNAPEGKREPSHQGFDEYYGIPRTSNEAQTGIAQGTRTPNSSFIWEGSTEAPARNVKPFDMETRRTVDRESAERGIAFMERSVRAKQPFFMYYPMTQIHFPTLSHPTSTGRPAPATSATRWPTWTTTSDSCSTPSTGSTSRKTPSSSGAPTTAPNSAAPGAGRPAPGAGSTTR
jgi:arylsulfatase